MPHVNYGDEVGQTGDNDPGSRACMIWDPAQQHAGLREHVRQLIALRRAHSALRSGSCDVLQAAPARRLFAFARQAGDDRLIVAIHAGRRPTTLVVPAALLGPASAWQDALSGARYAVEDGSLRVRLASWSGLVLRAI